MLSVFVFVIYGELKNNSSFFVVMSIPDFNECRIIGKEVDRGKGNTILWFLCCEVWLLMEDMRKYQNLWQRGGLRELDSCEPCDKGRFKLKLFELWVHSPLKFTELAFFMLKILSLLLCYSILRAVSIRFNIQFYETKQKNNTQTSSRYCETQLKNPFAKLPSGARLFTDWRMAFGD